MKKKLLKLLAERKELYLLELPKLMPEIKGEYTIYMSVKEGYNPNVLWLSGVSNKFIKVFNEVLIEEKTVDWKSINTINILIDNKAMYAGIPIINRKMFKQKKECWMPISIMLTT